MICCKCEKEITKEGSKAMILEDSDFGKYPKENYYCCNECYSLWVKIRNELLTKIRISKNITSHQAWLYLFFEFIDENPSRRIFH